MALCKAPTVFKAACAGAPVTFWEGYDTFYTERYMSTPQLNPEGYLSSSVMNSSENMSGRSHSTPEAHLKLLTFPLIIFSLLLIHGLIDENVHFRHTAKLTQSLNSRRKRYDLLVLPGERHSPHKLEARVYIEDRIFDFFRAHLLETVPREIISTDRGTPSDDSATTGGRMTSSGGRLVAHL